MRITANQLIALVWVARSGSLTGASQALGKTQPAVSAQLRQLGEVLGMPLLVRHRYGVALSPAAESLLPYAQACVRALEGAGQAMSRLRGMEEGKLRVLASTSVAAYMLPAALAQFYASYPRIEVALERCNAPDAMAALERGEGDLAVVRGATTAVTSAFAANFVTQVLTTDETLLVVPPMHPLSRRRRLAVSDLDGLEIVSREATSATRALVEDIAARAGIKFRVKFQTVGVEALKEAVLQGFGAGFLSKLAVQREVASGLLASIRIDAPELMQHITLAHPHPGQCPPTVPKFVGMVQALSLRGADRVASQRSRKH